jgi:hypothetical protein
LENVQAQLAGGVDVGVEHLADELDLGRLVGVLLFELHDEPKRSIFKRRIGWSYDDGIPVKGGRQDMVSMRSRSGGGVRG